MIGKLLNVARINHVNVTDQIKGNFSRNKSRFDENQVEIKSCHDKIDSMQLKIDAI